MTVNSSSQTLRERIDAWTAEHLSEFPEEVLRLFADKTEEVLRSGILDRCLRDGETAPDFELPDAEGRPVRLGELVGNGPAILSFYRGTWCPYCTLEFQALLESMDRFRSRGAAAVVALSPQVRDRRENPGIAGVFDLADAGNRIAHQFGLVYPLGEEIRRVYTNFGIRLDELNEEAGDEVPIPATYLVDRDRTVRYAHASADITDRAEPETLLRHLASLAEAS